MSAIQTTFVGLALFWAQLVIVMYLSRLAAIKLSNTNAGKGLAALLF